MFFFEDFCNVSSMVSIYAVNDDYTGMGMTNPMVPENLRKVDSRSVLIEKHVIIGTHSVVLPGCVLKEGSAFGAFSFINRDSEEWSRNVGIPFRRIGCRSKKVLELEQYLQTV